jgi:hypothetical protein
MRTLVEMQFGSHVYGTNTPTSDLDYKAVYIPEPREIILGTAKDSIIHSTKKDERAKNSADDVDLEMFSLKKYTKLLLEGQTVAIDMLFTPEKWYKTTSSEWMELKKNKDKFLHRGYLSFAGYCHTQANKYGIKGSRVSAVRKVVEYLSTLDSSRRLLDYDLSLITTDLEHAGIVSCRGPNGESLPHLEVCNKKVPFHATVKYALDVFGKVLTGYGERALQAEKNEGVDWKALSHAVRIANQAHELLLTGEVIFPRPNADLLLKIRKGELPYKQVAEMIEEGLITMQATSEVSPLPNKPDYQWAEDFVYESYLDHIGVKEFYDFF